MAWKSASHAQELQRLNTLLQHYESENLHQRRQLEAGEESKQEQIRRIQELEQDKVQLTKKLRSVEISLKFEKVASEGARKKAHTVEIDLIDVRERFENAKTELEMVKKKLTEMTATLQQERISRLQMMHEKERVQRLNEDLQIALSSTEADNIASHQKLLAQLQRVETLFEQNTRQDRLLDAQSQEIYTLNNEVVDYKLKTMDLNRTLEGEMDSHARYHHSIDYLQQEVSRLRKMLSDKATTLSETGHSVTSSKNAPAANALIAEVNKLTASRYHQSHFTADYLFSTRSSIANGTLPTSPSSGPPSLSLSRSGHSMEERASLQAQQRAAAETVAMLPSGPSRLAPHRSPPPRSVSPLSSAKRPRSTTDFPRLLEEDLSSRTMRQEEAAYFHSPERVAMLTWIRATGGTGGPRTALPVAPEVRPELSSVSSLGGGLSLPPLASPMPDRVADTSSSAGESSATSRHRGPPPLRSDAKSLFVGSGLGFKHNRQLDAQLKDLQAGSTKQILQRILEGGGQRA